MAYYLVSARLKQQRSEEFRRRLEAGEFQVMRPFGPSLTASLLSARVDAETGKALWEEQCFCSPPLAQEREAVFDHYFDELVTEEVEYGQGARRIAHLPSLWR